MYDQSPKLLQVLMKPMRLCSREKPLNHYLATELEKFTLNPLGVLKSKFCNSSLPSVACNLYKSSYKDYHH